MSDGYSEHFLEHMRAPRNTGPLPEANGLSETRNPVCGDFLRLMLRVDDGIVRAARFDAQGCGGAVAAASVLTDLIAGMRVEDALAVTRQRIVEEAGGLPASKLHVAQLAADAVRAALADWASRKQG